jgi:hypothetical protein
MYGTVNASFEHESDIEIVHRRYDIVDQFILGRDVTNRVNVKTEIRRKTESSFQKKAVLPWIS